MSSVAANSANPFALNTRRIVTAAVLVAITIVMAFTPYVGLIPLPFSLQPATTLHIPTTVGAILEGPSVGGLAGFIFGMFTLLFAPIKDPLVYVLPRILVGITPWLAYQGLRAVQRDFAAGVAGFVGSATNSVLFVALYILRGYVPHGTGAWAFVISILPQAIVEAALSVILSIIIVRAVMVVRERRTNAADNKDRSKMAY